MYLRFVIHCNDLSSGRRQGLFQALGEVENEGELLSSEQASWKHIEDWFEKNLKTPRKLARSSKTHAKKVALSWFKDSATEHIANMYALAQILDAHGILVDVIHTEPRIHRL